jgi:hypothetical protein
MLKCYSSSYILNSLVSSIRLAVHLVVLLPPYSITFLYPHVQTLGTLNGIATSITAMGRACGPFIAGQTFTWSISAGYVIIAFWLLAVVSIFGHILMWFIVNGDGFSGPANAREMESQENVKLDDWVIDGERDGRDDGAAGLLDSDSEDGDSDGKSAIDDGKELKA